MLLVLLQAVEECGVPLREAVVVYRLLEDLEVICNYHFGSPFELVQSARAQITKVGSYELKKRKGGKRTVVGIEVKQGSLNTQHTYTLVSPLSSQVYVHPNSLTDSLHIYRAARGRCSTVLTFILIRIPCFLIKKVML